MAGEKFFMQFLNHPKSGHGGQGGKNGAKLYGQGGIHSNQKRTHIWAEKVTEFLFVS
jgi:hypothetical protein